MQSRDLSYTESAALAKEQEEAILYRAMQSDIVSQVMRRLASVRRRLMQLRPMQSTPTASPTSGSATCARSTRCGATSRCSRRKRRDAIRAAARAAGCSERQVHTVAGAHFDWSSLLGASQALSLFADRQLVEIRIPSGKPGKDGSEALQRYCEMRDRRLAAATSSRWSSCRASTDRSSRAPGSPRSTGRRSRSASIRSSGTRCRQWIAQRLAAQGQHVAAGADGQRTLAFFADRVEGNLLAAHQEIQKLACSTRRARSASSRSRAAVLNVARYDVFRLGEAVLAGQAARALRMLEGLRSEGEAAVLVHWTLAEDIRGLKRVQGRGRRRQAAAAGAARGARLGRRRSASSSAPSPLDDRSDARPPARSAAQVCDGL